MPPGPKIAVLHGDPAKEGHFVMRLKAPDGFKVPPHYHPSDENLTVLQGTFMIGTGDKADAARPEAAQRWATTCSCRRRRATTAR